ncbi:FIST N-terminal domain-containing protein [Sulfitobacter sp. LCG007]
MDGAAPRVSPRFLRVGRSALRDAESAVLEAVRAIDLCATRFVLVFLPETLDPHELSGLLSRHLDGVPFFGCTTAGQITGNGYEDDALLLLAFPKENFRCASLLLDTLAPFSETQVATRAKRLSNNFNTTAGWNRLGFLFTDGLSKQEDLLASTLDTVLGGFPIFGGSAGDGFRFEKTFLLCNGEIHCNAALLLLVETDLEFQGLGFDHFLPSGPQIVITDADPDERLVYEINGAPAAQEYADLVGCAVEDLSPQIFAEYPMLLRHNQRFYVRAVRNVTETDALSFLAAIDDGLILTLGRGKEIIETLEAGLDLCDRKGQAPDFILGFDCALRKLEIRQKQLDRRVSEIFRNHRVLGFNTYGEQQSGVHMNQTFVGVAFFEPEPRAITP